MNLTWHLRGFDDLAVRELYAIVVLRERVFVVEQRCAYQDADGLDPACRHLWAERDGAIAAYLRLVPAGAKFPELTIGRVITAPEARGMGLGREVMRRGIDAAGDVAIRVFAQAHLERFYAELGFARASDVYEEDGIPHVEMVRPASPGTPTPRAA